MSNSSPVEDDPFGLNDTLEVVRNIIATDALISQPSNSPYPELLLLEFEDITIRMDASLNHSRPHLHLDYGVNKNAASYAVDDGSWLVGIRKYDRPMGSWVREHRATLMKAWTKLRSGKDTSLIVAKLKATSFPKK